MAETQRLSPNSAEFWLPRVTGVASGLVPATVVVPYDHLEAIAAMEDGTDDGSWSVTIAAVRDALNDVGSPAFLRTDLASAKHDGPDSYRITQEPGVVERCMSFTVQDNEIKFWPVGPYPRSFMVRAFLDLDAPFVAFGGHPIAREWRYFATADEVTCRHFYWPEHAIFGADRDDWSSLLAKMANESPPPLDDVAIAAAGACADGAPSWSVDFAQDRDGKWWLIDMATADSSWHPDHEGDDG